MGIVVPHDHNFANRRELEIKDLQNESFILTEKGCTYRAFLLEKLHEDSISHTISMELSSVETIKKAINNHWGIGFLPLFTVEEDDPFLKTIPLVDPALNFHRQLLYRKEKEQLAVYNTFMDLCKI